MLNSNLIKGYGTFTPHVKGALVPCFFNKALIMREERKLERFKKKWLKFLF